MAAEYTIQAIGTVQCGRSEAVDDHWESEESTIVLDGQILGDSAADGLDSFSHIEVIFVFDQVTEGEVIFDARRPRGNESWPLVGILAQRGKNRPNRLGATICELVSVQENRITVSGLDAIDGTPVVDIKPVMSGFLPRRAIVEPDWAREIMADYW